MKGKRIHFIGICGLGMSALAVMLKDMGAKVSGSDEGFYEPAASYLKRNNIEILTPHKKENLPENVDIIVIGRHAKLNPEENEEVRLALNYPEKIKSFPEILSDITKDRENIVVAGSYGKSTCTSLLIYCLLNSGIQTGYFVGAISNDLKESAHIGTEKYFVLEGDEYPAYGGVSKFLYLHPKHLLLISTDHDHINVFPTVESYLEPYKKLVQLLPANGLLVAETNNPNIKEVIKENKATLVTYGTEKNTEWYPNNIKYGEITTFDLFQNGKKVVELSTPMMGKHNIENIVGVSAFLLEKKMITPEQLSTAISSFHGLKRRLDLVTDKSSVLVYEGFGSSYTKAKTVFDALKLHFPNKRLITVFEPHTFSWRNKNTVHWYNDIFNTSSEIVILPPPEHGANTQEQMTFTEIINAVKKNNSSVRPAENEQEALEIIKKITKKDDLVVLVSSGPLFGLTTSVPKLMEQIFPR